VDGLGEKLGVLLVQFPPDLAFESGAAGAFFEALQCQSKVAAVCEPRHASWFTADVNGWMQQRRIARVAADPARVAGADDPGGWRGISYFRLHGSPRIYYSSYDEHALTSFASTIECLAGTAPVWCISANTAGAALDNALFLREWLAAD
jgi:uncharacterized protein YecE (DUF72 family)